MDYIIRNRVYCRDSGSDGFEIRRIDYVAKSVECDGGGVLAMLMWVLSPIPLA